FKAGILKVIIATTSLAVGVNFPAKTVVFLNDDSNYLLPSTFYQIMGRAGRKIDKNSDKNENGKVIITGNFKFQRIQSLFFKNEEIKSNECLHMIDILKLIKLQKKGKGPLRNIKDNI